MSKKVACLMISDMTIFSLDFFLQYPIIYNNNHLLLISEIIATIVVREHTCKQARAQSTKGIQATIHTASNEQYKFIIQ